MGVDVNIRYAPQETREMNMIHGTFVSEAVYTQSFDVDESKKRVRNTIPLGHLLPFCPSHCALQAEAIFEPV